MTPTRTAEDEPKFNFVLTATEFCLILGALRTEAKWYERNDFPVMEIQTLQLRDRMRGNTQCQ
jgi:hypothetical protein